MTDQTDLVAYCGDCFGYQGRIADLARGLRKELRKAKFGKVAGSLAQEVSFFKGFESYQTAYDVMGMMVRLRCKNACRAEVVTRTAR